jgi:2-dehydro-3-deoxyphosphogluconate aldolase/(4S)-4-hydroxy-2-oxoglutarate aldolase
MTRFARLDVLNAIVATGLVPVFYHPDAEVARNVARAVAAGGCRLLEFTNRGDFAPDVFRDLSMGCRGELPDMMLGVGSVVDAPTAALYIAHGASFMVSPSLDPDTARLCNRRKIAYIPGCGSVSEIARAEELGVEIVKVFPGDAVGGPEFVKAVLGPCPWTCIMVTGGVEATQESIQRWFKAGATAVGVGSHLLRKEWIQAGDWDAISAKTAELLGWIRTA